MFLIVVRVGVIFGVVALRVADHLLVFFEASGVLPVADQTGFAGDDGTFFKDELDGESAWLVYDTIRYSRCHQEQAHEP